MHLMLNAPTDPVRRDAHEVLNRQGHCGRERTKERVTPLMTDLNTLTKHDAVVAISPTTAKKNDEALQHESRAARGQ